MKNKIRKFLPNYDGPYFILGHLDDLVYGIQRSPRAKVKVVHHDKLKPYHSRQPLENSWVFKDSEVWQPQEVPALNLEADGAELDLDLSGLFTEENYSGTDSMPSLDDTGVSMLEQDPKDVQWSEGSTVQQDSTGTLNGQMRGDLQGGLGTGLFDY